MNNIIEKEGTYKGIRFWIIRTDMSWPCAYIDVRNIPGFKFCPDDYENNDIICHGGCTYADYELVVGNMVFVGKIVGWDYAHLGDWSPVALSGKKWTKEEVMEEVEEVIDDLLNRYPGTAQQDDAYEKVYLNHDFTARPKCRSQSERSSKAAISGRGGRFKS